MRQLLISACCLLLFPAGLSAQCASDIGRIMMRANESLAAEDYRLAIERLLFARDECPDRKDEINALIKQTFAQIDQEKREAETAREEAIVARNEAEAARVETLREKAKADSALDVANRVLDRLYFYKGKFGLTVRNVGDKIEPRYRYGFINRQGEEMIPFKFDGAAPFSGVDSFARVRIGARSYLLDTSGRTYLRATSFKALKLETQALDLHENRYFLFRKNISKFQNLEVILARNSFNRGSNSILGRLPKRLPGIGNLEKLRILDLSGNYINQLPPKFWQLSQLQTLNLSDTQLSQLPPEIGQLSQLKTLDLSDNQLSQLPSEIGQLSQLKTLDLTRNQLSTLPKELCDLTALRNKNRWTTQCWISGNPLTHLPACYLDKFTKEELIDFSIICMRDSLYHVAYQTIDNLLQRFPQTSQGDRESLINELDGLEEAGIFHEDFPNMRALLKPEED